MDYDFSKLVEVDFNGTSVSEVYLDDTLVWSKPKLLDFSFLDNTLTKYNGSSSSVTIPTSYSIIQAADGSVYFVEGNDIAVTAIGDNAFSGSSMESVTIPNTITSIGSQSFGSCSKLKSVTIPDSVTSLGEAAFVMCGSLQSIKFSNSLTTVPNTVCGLCYELTTITLPSGATSIGSQSFVSCEKLTNFTFPSTITSIGDSAFSGCYALTSISLPKSLKTVGKSAFQDCINAVVTVADSSISLTSIGDRAFLLTKSISCISYISKATTLGKSCVACREGFTYNSNDYANLEKLRATQENGTYYTSNYDSSIIAHSNIYASFLYLIVSHTSGENSPSISVKGTMTINTGLHTVTINHSLGFGESRSMCCLYNSSYKGNPSASASYSVNSSSNVSSHSGSQTNKGFYTIDSNLYCYRIDYKVSVVSTCLVEGTLITLADGTHKKVEDLNYNDLLRVWNLETGKFDIQYPLAIVKGEQHGVKYRLTIEDGTYLEICGQHDIFDPEIHRFRTYGEGAIYEIDPNEDYYVMKDIGTNEFLSQKIMNIEIIHEDVTAYGIITSGTITTFANDMMIGLGVLNLVPITEENKFDKVFETLKESCYTYDRLVEEIYSDVEEDLAIGLNLLMTDIYHKEASGLPNLVAPFRNRKPLPNYKGKKLHYLALDDGELTTIRSFENEITVLPEIKTPGKTKWYIVGEYKYLEPGDTYITKFSTVIKTV